MKFRFALVAGAAISLMASAASAVDWGGYVRVGPGQKQNSGDSKKCFNGGAQQGHGGIGRLGNECETYGEFALSQTAQAGGVNYKALLMTNFYNAGSDPGGNNLQVNQIYVEGKGYDIAPNQTFWIGRRFYHRADVHMDDAFFIDMSGSGAGVDGISVGGGGSLSVSLFRTNDDNSLTYPNIVYGGRQIDGTQPNGTLVNPNAGTRVNVDLEGLNVNPGGKLRLTAVFTKFGGPGGKDGAGFSLQHNQTGVLGGENTLWAQATRGSAYLNMSSGGATDGSNVKRWRIADSLAWLNGPLTGQTLLDIGEEKRAGAKDKFWSAAGRAGYALSTNFKLQAELGYSENKPQNASKQTISKFTIAPTLTVGPNYYDRPELRFYVSTFKFNNAYKIANGQSKTSKTAAGFQAEMWF